MGGGRRYARSSPSSSSSSPHRSLLIGALVHRLFILSTALGLLITGFEAAQGLDIGVNYGMLGDNLPPPDKVVALYKSINITKLRLFNPDPTALKALQGSGIDVVLGTLNQDLQQLATDPSYAASWVATNISPYVSTINFRYITAGNEVIPGDLAASVLPAIQNLDKALKAVNISTPVTTAIATAVLGTSYPPSQGVFSQEATSVMAPIVNFLSAKKIPLLVNVYPYFAYSGDPNSVRLDYALFEADDIVVQDGSLGYTNLFDAIVDGVYSALEKVGGESVEVVVSETGWPSGGGATGATVENARKYNNNVVLHVGTGRGTPKRPGKVIETYLFAMFNEDLKPAGTEQNFGLYHPDMSQVYPVDFNY